MKNLTLRQIRIFISVAEHLHFKRAAQSLFLSAPAVSMQIRQIEDDLGMPLFDREGKAVSLTTAGEYFLAYARRISSILREAEDLFSRLNRLEGGRLTVGMVSTAEYFVPQLLARFRREHPHIDISLYVSNREGLLAALREHKIDLAIMGRPPRDLAARAEPFAMHPLVLIAAPDHPLAQQTQLSLQSLNNIDFLIRETGSGTRAAVEYFLNEARVTPHFVMEMSSNETIKQAVMAGMGVSIISLHTVGLEVKHNLLTVIPIDGLPIIRSWHVMHLQSKTLSLAAEALRYFILEEGEAYFANDPVFAKVLQ